ncbi:MAG TPA: glycosyltransferase family 2 protein [Patescibacteria group bacterium]|nr:glycosyltransferase family 2 protein [Patescibacteria group bacterium]
MSYSLILPVFNEANTINTLFKRISKIMDQQRSEYELIFINDGSTDATNQLLTTLHQQYPLVKIINFSRNFGHQTAVTAGLNYAQGDIIAVLDADLQDPPEVLPLFFEKIHDGYDVVYAIRKNRKEKKSIRFMYSLFYRLLKIVANIDIPLDSGDFCVMRKNVVDAINSLPERNRFVRGLRSWVGYKQIGLAYERNPRYAGKSKYNMSKLMKLAFDGIFSFSYVPLQIMFYVGLGSLMVSFIGSIIAVYMRFFTTAYKQVPGFATTIILIMFVGGLQLFSLGIMGEYMRRVYDEVKQRKPYIVESLVGFKK